MPPKLAKAYQQFYDAVKVLDFSKGASTKKQFVAIALAFRQDVPLEEPQVPTKKKASTATAKKPKKTDALEDGEVSSRKKVMIGVVEEKPKKARSKTSRK